MFGLYRKYVTAASQDAGFKREGIMEFQIIKRTVYEITFIFKTGMETFTFDNLKNDPTEDDLIRLFASKIKQATLFENPDEIVLYQEVDGAHGTLCRCLSVEVTQERLEVFGQYTRTVSDMPQIFKLVKLL
jgi:hypothetical protein